ncbi:hypothetical protein [Thermanaeromonas toyohensis]|nr:hypothetical protein [Thermanaeromonas toyohensis]
MEGRVTEERTLRIESEREPEQAKVEKQDVPGRLKGWSLNW